MGRSQAEGMAEAVAAGHASLREALAWHLFANHYPPVNPAFIPAAESAIYEVREGHPEAQITLPNQRVKRAWEVIDGLHLEEFLGDADNE